MAITSDNIPLSEPIRDAEAAGYSIRRSEFQTGNLDPAVCELVLRAKNQCTNGGHQTGLLLTYVFDPSRSCNDCCPFTVLSLQRTRFFQSDRKFQRVDPVIRRAPR